MPQATVIFNHLNKLITSGFNEVLPVVITRSRLLDLLSVPTVTFNSASTGHTYIKQIAYLPAWTFMTSFCYCLSIAYGWEQPSQHMYNLLLDRSLTLSLLLAIRQITPVSCIGACWIKNHYITHFAPLPDYVQRLQVLWRRTLFMFN